jgi:probable HAF family extracellular repeat protein
MEVIGDLPGGVLFGRDGTVSNNGVIAATGQTEGFNGLAARWTSSTGWQTLIMNEDIGSDAKDISADGSVIVGIDWNASGPNQAFRWTEATGIEYLQGILQSHYARAVSADGTVIVGSASRFDGTRHTDESFRWTSTTGMVGLGHPLGDFNNYATGISADGSVIVGHFNLTDFVRRSFRWTQDTGMVEIPLAPGLPSHVEFIPSAISGNGSVVLGGVIIWDAEHGTRRLQEVLIHEHGLAAAMAGWAGLEATGISTDGRVLVGSGVNPQGRREAWIANLDQPASANGLPGNFNGDGSVDASDYVAWRDGLGTKHTPHDYGVWKSNFGSQRPAESYGTPVSAANLSSTKELQSFVVDGVTYTQDNLIQPQLVEYVGWPERNNSIIQSPGESVPSPGSRGGLLTHDFQMDSGITNPASATLNFSPPLVNGPGPDLVVFEIARNASEAPDMLQIEINSANRFLASWGPMLSTVDFETHWRDERNPANISELENDVFSQLSKFTGSPVFGMAIDLSEVGVSPLAQTSTIRFRSAGIESFDPVLFMGIRSAGALAGAFNNDRMSQASIPEPTSVALSLFALVLCIACPVGFRLRSDLRCPAP